ncbi:protein kinase [Acidiferrimicrobium sp. IK]|uniref:protein kinase domain-containing protein n=1 Tax=Acidiferrimicrobium sp. IK TaxID=2871700 RepID=UPI0021CB2D60|nr:protein kinase [Acidiferrimicrobium sp. IK]MCU4184896.1 protein kinase [Acidiferrimicrobium sp. IK]
MTALTGDDRTLAGRYRLGGRLGQGAMAEVYDGLDTRLERSVAVKVLRADSVLGPEGRARFAREAKAAARLSHPHSVAIYDTGTDGDVAYIVMERLPGTTMADYMRAGPLPLDWVATIAADVLDALGAAHAAGLTHRDIKPGNILITPDDRAKVADFGIAKLADGEGDLTATGLVIGTAAYLPPERIDGHEASPQGDLYALGVVLYEALAGRKPFTGESPLAVAYAARHGQPPDLGRLRPDLPPAMIDAVATAMAPDPADRFATAGDMAAAIRSAASTPPAEQYQPTAILGGVAAGGFARPGPEATAVLPDTPRRVQPPPDLRRRRVTAAAVAAAVVLAALVAVLATRHSPQSARASTTTRPKAAVAAAAPTTAPATTVPSTTATAPQQTTAVTAPAASDPQAAALQAAASALANSGGDGAQAAQILDQVASLPADQRAAAAAVAETLLRGLYASGGLTQQQYQQALAPLVAITGTPTGTATAPTHHGKGDHGGG